jgi:hypothetical protein
MVMLIYILTQTLPLAIKARLDRNDFNDLPILLTVPHDGSELDKWEESVGKEAQLSEEEKKLLLAAEAEDTTESAPPPELLPPGLWKYLDASPDGDDLDLSEVGNDVVSSEPIYVDPYWSIKSKNFSISNYLDDDDDTLYNIPSTPSHPVEYPNLSMNAVPEDPSKPSLQQLEDYFLNNYKTNMDKGLSRFSLSVTEATLEQGPLVGAFPLCHDYRINYNSNEYKRHRNFTNVFISNSECGIS